MSNFIERSCSKVSIQNLRHAIVYQCKNLGDCLLTTPLIRTLLDRMGPDSRVTVICKPSASIIFSSIDKRVTVVPRPRSIKDWVVLLKVGYRADLMFLPHASSQGLAIASVLRLPSVSRYGLRALKFLAATYQTPSIMMPWRHTVETHFDLLRRIGVVISPSELCVDFEYLVPGATEACISLKGPYIIVHPGTRWMFKTSSPEFWEATITELVQSGIQVVLTGSHEDEEGALLERLSKIRTVRNLAGKTSIGELAYLIKNASAYLGVDTFATHFAAGLGVKGVAIYGPTSELIWGPYGTKSRIEAIVHNDKPCRPCHADGCGGSKISDCLVELDPREVAAHIIRMVG